MIILAGIKIVVETSETYNRFLKLNGFQYPQFLEFYNVEV